MALRASARTLLAHVRATRLYTGTPFSLGRQYHCSPSLASYKDDQDRQSLKPRRSESTLSTSDDEVAKTKAAFTPMEKNTPEGAMENTAGSPENPLEASAANQAFSKPLKPEEPRGKPDKKPKSLAGNAQKHGIVNM